MIKAICDHCLEEIKNQEKDIVDFRITSYEIPSNFNATGPKTPVPATKMIILCRSCNENFSKWLEKR